MARFDIENLSFSYPESNKNVLDGICASIGEGEYVCLCGPSGCGKTTLLRHMKSALRPNGTQSGHVLFNGIPLDDIGLREQSAAIGFVMQDPNAQIVTDKVWHELAFGLENLGIDQQVMHMRVAEMACFFGIEDWFHDEVSTLSGGQKQLLNLASIMAMHPDVLLLDEPTSQLDPIAAADFLDTVKRINVELGTTIIIVEQRLENVFATASRVLVMENGSLRHDGAPREVSFRLCDEDNPMSLALPTPIRVYYALSGPRQGIARGGTDDAGRLKEDCPLTVQEGRAWLTIKMREIVHSHATANEKSEPAPLPADAALLLKGIWFRYDRNGEDVLRGLELSVPENHIHAIVGANGGGKSTMLKCACGICKPYRGSVSIFGKRLSELRKSETTSKFVSMLPQNPLSLFSRETVRKDLEEMIDANDRASNRAQDKIDELSRLFKIEGILESHPYDLSGGELQRAALAKVLMTRPRILLLDEPTKGLDEFLKRELAGMLKKLLNEGITIVMVSHDIEFCARNAHQVSMLFDGSIVSTNDPRSFFAQNSFYTTAANRMSRKLLPNAVTDEEIIDSLQALMPL